MATVKINDYFQGGKVVFVKKTTINNKKKVLICTIPESLENDLVGYPSQEEEEEERRINEQLDFEEEVERFLRSGKNDQDFSSRKFEEIRL